MKTSNLNRVYEDATDVANIAEMILNANHPDFIKNQAEKIIALGKRLMITVDKDSAERSAVIKMLSSRYQEN